ncbi:MAG: M23 family peptidase, partial [Burkholderiales bacterium]|nr:M23 family peptidase [Burkholderiales bacterium]
MSPLCATDALSRRRVVQTALGAVSLACLPALAKDTSKAGAPSAGSVWPKPLHVPGGIARLALGPASARPRAHAGDVPVLVLGTPSGWTAVVGIPLAAEPGSASVAITAEGGTVHQMGYTVAHKRYVEQHLKVSPRTVDLSPDDLARFERERDHQNRVIATYTDAPAQLLAQPDALRMRVPVSGRRSSSFGLRRVFN